MLSVETLHRLRGAGDGRCQFARSTCVYSVAPDASTTVAGICELSTNRSPSCTLCGERIGFRDLPESLPGARRLTKCMVVDWEHGSQAS